MLRFVKYFVHFAQLNHFFNYVRSIVVIEYHLAYPSQAVSLDLGFGIVDINLFGRGGAMIWNFYDGDWII